MQTTTTHIHAGQPPVLRLNRFVLGHAEALLTTALTFAQPADVAAAAYFREHRALGRRDRATVAEAVFALLRRRRVCEALAQPGPTPRRLLLVVLARFLAVPRAQLAGLLASGEGEWLDQVAAADLEALPAAERCNLPDWLYQRLLAEYGPQETAALARANDAQAPLDLRVNSLKTSREAALRRLAADGIAAAPCPFSPLGIRLVGKPSLVDYPLLANGELEVQDEGSQLLGLLLDPQPGDKVVDFCAGAGGKTLLLGALMGSSGRLYAFDVSAARLARFKPRFKRSGLSNVQAAPIAHENDTRVKRLVGQMDRVLVDAPCSGLGTLRRNPDLKWRQGPADVAELALKQRRILESAARLLRPGGRLVYATCSLLREENEAVVAAFLAADPRFRLLNARAALATRGIALACGEYLKLLPHHHGTEGFFGALLERAG